MQAVLIWFVLGPLPGLCATALLWSAKRLHDRQSHRRRWRLSNPQGLRICISASPNIESGTYFRPTTGIGQAKALALVAPSLIRAWRDVDAQNVYFANEISGSGLETDLILIGGPKTNSLSARVLDLVGEAYGIRQQGSTIVAGNSEFEGEVADDATGTDYGLLLHINNPFAQGHRLVLLSGSHTFGTVAAARFMTSSPAVPRRSGEFAFVIKASVEKGHALPATIVWSSDDD